MKKLDVNNSDLGDYIKKVLNQKHWSIRKAAIRIDISASYISKIINHKAIANPKSETLDKIADGLHVSREDVYEASNRAIAPSASIEPSNNSDGIDLERAIDNHEYMTYGGKEIDPEDLELIKRILRNNK